MVALQHNFIMQCRQWPCPLPMFSRSSSLLFCFGSPLLCLFPAQLLSPKLSLNLKKQHGTSSQLASGNELVSFAAIFCSLLAFDISRNFCTTCNWATATSDTQSPRLDIFDPELKAWSAQMCTCRHRQEQTAGNNLRFGISGVEWVLQQSPDRTGLYFNLRIICSLIKWSIFPFLSLSPSSWGSGQCWHCCCTTHMVVEQILLSLQDNGMSGGLRLA